MVSDPICVHLCFSFVLFPFVPFVRPHVAHQILFNRMPGTWCLTLFMLALCSAPAYSWAGGSYTAWSPVWVDDGTIEGIQVETRRHGFATPEAASDWIWSRHKNKVITYGCEGRFDLPNALFLTWYVRGRTAGPTTVDCAPNGYTSGVVYRFVGTKSVAEIYGYSASPPQAGTSHLSLHSYNPPFYNSDVEASSGMIVYDPLTPAVPKNFDLCEGEGNPIHRGIGDKYQVEIDLTQFGYLDFKRTYHSSEVAVRGAFNSSWRHTYERRLTTVVNTNFAEAYATRASGRQLFLRAMSAPGSLTPTSPTA